MNGTQKNGRVRGLLAKAMPDFKKRNRNISPLSDTLFKLFKKTDKIGSLLIGFPFSSSRGFIVLDAWEKDRFLPGMQAIFTFLFLFYFPQFLTFKTKQVSVFKALS